MILLFIYGAFAHSTPTGGQAGGINNSVATQCRRLCPQRASRSARGRSGERFYPCTLGRVSLGRLSLLWGVFYSHRVYSASLAAPNMAKPETNSTPPPYGSGLAARLDLRQHTFPRRKSWAYAPLGEKKEERAALAAKAVDGPSLHSNGSFYDSAVRGSDDNSPLATKLLDLNKRLTRGRSDARLFARSEKYTLQQDAAGLLMMARLRRPDGSLTQPVLLHTGPFSTLLPRQHLRARGVRLRPGRPQALQHPHAE